MLLLTYEIIFRADFWCVDTFLGTESESTKIFQIPPMRADLRIGRINVITCLRNYISTDFLYLGRFLDVETGSETGSAPQKPNSHR